MGWRTILIARSRGRAGLDAAAQDLIFRVVDVRSRQVVRQVPDEALLRMRAYARALAQGKGMIEALNAANLEI